MAQMMSISTRTWVGCSAVPVSMLASWLEAEEGSWSSLLVELLLHPKQPPVSIQLGVRVSGGTYRARSYILKRD
jgi:hypothetical protein